MVKIKSSRVIPVILIIVIAIIAVVAVVSLVRTVFFSGPAPSGAPTDTSRQALLSSDVNRSVRMTMRGPIVADENFESYQIVISPNNRTLTTYKGYLDAAVDNISLGNNVAAYEEFVYALDKAGLPAGNELSEAQNDTRGTCASGSVYEFTILNGSDSVKRLWTSTCSGSKGSLTANVGQLRTLFENQIPNSRQTINRAASNNSFRL